MDLLVSRKAKGKPRRPEARGMAGRQDRQAAFDTAVTDDRTVRRSSTAHRRPIDGSSTAVSIYLALATMQQCSNQQSAISNESNEATKLLAVACCLTGSRASHSFIRTFFYLLALAGLVFICATQRVPSFRVLVLPLALQNPPCTQDISLRHPTVVMPAGCSSNCLR